MPVDASIPLQARAPVFPNAIEQLQQGASMRDALAQTQQRQQQTQMEREQTTGLEQENQQRQMDIEDQQKWRQAYTEAGGDMDKAFGLATQRGVGPRTLMPIRQAITQAAEARAKLSVSESEAEDAKHDRINALLQPVFQEPDPAKQQQLWDQQSQQAVHEGLMTPEQAKQHPYPGPAGVQDYAHSLVTNKWITAQAAKTRAQAIQQQADTAQANAQRAKDEAQARLPGIQAESNQKVTANEAGQLGAAARQGQAQYAAKYYALPEARRTAYTHPDDFDPAQTPKEVEQVGMTPAQRSAQANQEAQKTIEKQRIDLERQRVALSTGENARSLSADQRQAYSQFKDLTKQEDQVNQTRSRLGSALVQRNVYIDKTGLPKKLDDDQSVKESQIADMQARYDATNQQLKNIIDMKYRQGVRLGMKTNVPLEDVNKAIDAGDASLRGRLKGTTTGPNPPAGFTPPTTHPAAPAAPKPGQTAPKFTEQQVRARAASKGLDPEAAVKLARENKLIP